MINRAVNQLSMAKLKLDRSGNAVLAWRIFLLLPDREEPVPRVLPYNAVLRKCGRFSVGVHTDFRKEVDGLGLATARSHR